MVSHFPLYTPPSLRAFVVCYPEPPKSPCNNFLCLLLMAVALFAIVPAAGPFSIYLLCATVSGVFMGAVGIGGVLLVPLLLLLDVPVLTASRAVLASMCFAGATGFMANKHHLSRELLLPIGLATVPGALLGALASPMVPPVVMCGTVGALATACGGQTIYAIAGQRQTLMRRISSVASMQDHSLEEKHSCVLSPSATEESTEGHEFEPLSPRNPRGTDLLAAGTAALGHDDDHMRAKLPHSLPIAQALAAGVAIGFFSLLTSTGGATVAIPLLLQLDATLPPSLVVALTQALSIPISMCSTLVAALSPEAASPVDFGLALCIGTAVALGVPFGARLSRQADPAHLKLAIGLLLLGVGLSTLWKTVARPMPPLQLVAHGASESQGARPTHGWRTGDKLARLSLGSTSNSSNMHAHGGNVSLMVG